MSAGRARSGNVSALSLCVEVLNRTGNDKGGASRALRAPRRAVLERVLRAAAEIASRSFDANGAPRLRASSAHLEGPGRRYLTSGRAAVDVVWVRDREMRRLNRLFRRGAAGRAGTTDVLAFPYADQPTGAGAGRKTGRRTCIEKAAQRPLGEIVCNLELAGERAREQGNSREAEAVLYATHGLVHLLGGEDGTARGRRTMRAIETASLARSGLRVRGGEWEES